MRKKKLRREQFLNRIINEYTTSDNLYPKGMTDTEFARFIIEYFLGVDYYIADPVSHDQANTIIAKEIISNN